MSWISQRQKIVAVSTTEAEYIAASDATKEAIWLRRLLESVGAKCDGPTMMRFDKQESIKLIKNPEFHKRTKNIDVRYHFIREVYEDGHIDISYVASADQLADMLTKALPKVAFLRNRDGLQFVDGQKVTTGGSFAAKE